ncbi:hypothetical protein Bca52824_065600 [Brassica carinata]|uniref:Uncharacterized protein n=1 Tax=Brassica carinata TaxID=52824 RepID=A0A8X7QMC1_BRACI|nr:hypothetical protein Bca52824_065600 [Brassica carinata]
MINTPLNTLNGADLIDAQLREPYETNEAPPPRGQTLRLRHSPRFETPLGNQPSIHPDPPELTNSTLSPPQTSSTQVNPISESINRLFEISSVTIHLNHREESFTRTISVNHGRASIVLRRDLHQP